MIKSKLIRAAILGLYFTVLPLNAALASGGESLPAIVQGQLPAEEINENVKYLYNLFEKDTSSIIEEQLVRVYVRAADLDAALTSDIGADKVINESKQVFKISSLKSLVIYATSIMLVMIGSIIIKNRTKISEIKRD